MARGAPKTGKIKSSSAAKKRFAKTGSGKWIVQKSSKNHLLLQKSKRQKKAANRPLMVSKGVAKKAKIIAPYL